MFGESSIQLGKLKLAAAALTANAIELQQQIRIIAACEKYRTRVSFIEYDLRRSTGILSSRVRLFGHSLRKARKAQLGEKENFQLDARGTVRRWHCAGYALPNYDELEMDRPTLGDGIIDARFQSSMPDASLCVTSED